MWSAHAALCLSTSEPLSKSASLRENIAAVDSFGAWPVMKPSCTGFARPWTPGTQIMNVGACGQAVRLFYQNFFDYSNWQVLCCRVRPQITDTGWAK
jgi:hypothetical protein